MFDGYPIIDSIIHAYNFHPSNYANKHAMMLANDVWGFAYATSRPGYRLSREGFDRDWTAQETASVAFAESYSDMAVTHVLPIRAYKDGQVSVEKNREFLDRWPNRMIAYVGVDPTEGQRALEDLEEQVEAIPEAIGLKLYPNSWLGDKISGWFMDDPEIAFPVFQRAQDLGLKVIAVHKAVPLGPVPREHYGMADIDRAAMAFPDLQFEVVHGGMAFLEETAWQLAMFSNVWVNLEITSSLVCARPAAFNQAMAAMLMSPLSLDRIFWGTGSVGFHSRPLIESFVRDFAFTPQQIEEHGLPEMDEAAKRKILAENYARLAGVDLAEQLKKIAGDEFDRGPDAEPAAPWSTTSAATHAE